MSNRIQTLVQAMIGLVASNTSLDKLTAQTIAVELSTVPENANYNALTNWANKIRSEVKEVYAKLHPAKGKASMVRISRAITVVLNDRVIAKQWALGKYNETVKLVSSNGDESIFTVPSLQAAYKMYRGETTESLPSIEKVVKALIAEKFSVEDVTVLFEACLEETEGDEKRMAEFFKSRKEEQKAA